MQLIDLILGLSHQLLGAALCLDINSLLGDHLLCLLLSLTNDALSLTASLADQLIAGLHDGTGLLQFTGELGDDLIQHIQNSVPLYDAFICGQGHGTCILHHVIQRANNILSATVTHLFIFLLERFSLLCSENPE